MEAAVFVKILIQGQTAPSHCASKRARGSGKRRGIGGPIVKEQGRLVPGAEVRLEGVGNGIGSLHGRRFAAAHHDLRDGPGVGP